MNSDLSAQQAAGVGATTQGGLDGLDLHGDSRENRLLQPVELVETTPGPTLDNPNEYPSHALHINSLCECVEVCVCVCVCVCECVCVCVNVCMRVV